MGREFAKPVENALAGLGHEVVCLYPADYSDYERDRNIERRQFKANRIERAIGIVFGSSTVAGEIMRGAGAIMNQRSEVIQAYFAYPPGFAAAILKKMFPSKCLVITVSGVDVALLEYKERYGLRWNWRKRMMISFALRTADCVVAPSDFGRKLAVQSGARSSKVRVIPWPFELPETRADGMADPNPPLTRPPIVLAASRHVPFKGLDILIEAMHIVRETVPEAELVLTGKPTQYTHVLRKLVFSLGLEKSVHFVGFVARSEMRNQYERASVFCQPGLADLFAISALEAMACGKPVVVTTLVGLESFMKGMEVGLIVPPFNPKELASAICLLLTDQTLNRKMGSNARKFSEAFTPMEIARKYSKMYLEAKVTPS
jgi:glycosyltransferase involved in cell wall biosynthesis